MMLRVVLDTNVLVSAFISPRGTCAGILRNLVQFTFVACFNPDMLEEIKSVLRSPKLIKIRPNDDDEVDHFLRYLQKYCIITEGTISVHCLQEDPDDDMILACAVEARADVIVSGDSHLLSLGEYEHIPIFKPAEFMQSNLLV